MESRNSLASSEEQLRGTVIISYCQSEFRHIFDRYS